MQQSSTIHHKREERKFMDPQNTTIHYIGAPINGPILYVLLTSGVVLTGIPHKKSLSVITIPPPTSRNKRLGYSTAASRNVESLHINKKLLFG